MIGTKVMLIIPQVGDVPVAGRIFTITALGEDWIELDSYITTSTKGFKCRFKPV